jgi:hypothetical protein
MPCPSLDVGAILSESARQHGLSGLSGRQRQAVSALSACRTARLGGRVEQCPCCGRREHLYNSCRDRHCPRCQAGQRAAWLEREAGCLLPVEYHHVVFTLPAEVAQLARDNARVVYGLLFEASSQAVRQVAADPRHLGAQVGLVAVLHTWGQALGLHPHVHLLATGGGLSCNRAGEVDAEPAWKSCRPGFFLPVRVLSALFRGKCLAGLDEAWQEGKLLLAGPAGGLACPRAWAQWLAGQHARDWVVYSQPPCAGAEVVLKYLARYIGRVAISNGRLVAASAEEVAFQYKDYRRQGQVRQMTLGLEEFARRFLQHVLPRGLVRVRHYGLLASRGREEKLRLCRELLEAREPEPAAERSSRQGEPRRCPACGQGQMQAVQVLGRQAQARQEMDSS